MPLKEIAVSSADSHGKLLDLSQVQDHDKLERKENEAKDVEEKSHMHTMDPNSDQSTEEYSITREKETSEANECYFVASSIMIPTTCRSKIELFKRNSSINSTLTVTSNNANICRICHCEGDDESPLVTPCLCLGSLQHVHQACIQQWIKSSNTKSCELCRFQFVMQSKLKPFGKWEKLDMSTSERRKIICSVSLHIIAIMCVVWALYVLIDRTSEDLQASDGSTPWSFWTKLVVVATGFMGGLVFMYVQCKVYIHMWLRWKAYNRIIYVQNCPADERLKARQVKMVSEPPLPQIEVIN